MPPARPPRSHSVIDVPEGQDPSDASTWRNSSFHLEEDADKRPRSKSIMTEDENKIDKAPPMVPGNAETDRQYLDKHAVQAAIGPALARVIREKPANPMKLIAQIISPDTFVDVPDKAPDVLVVEAPAPAEEPPAE